MQFTQQIKMLARFLVMPAALLVTLAFSSAASAQEYANAAGPQLFANQYTQGYSNQATAQMYIAPKPVPAWVGHTYYTYQPLYPHEVMHSPHAHRYHAYYDNGKGLNRTRVGYSTSPQYHFQHFIKRISLPRW